MGKWGKKLFDRKEGKLPLIHHAERRVYHQFRRNCISSTRSVVYHQAAGRCTLARDEIQPKGLMICTALRAAMSYQACGLDKKIPSPQTWNFLAPPNNFEPLNYTFTYIMGLLNGSVLFIFRKSLEYLPLRLVRRLSNQKFPATYYTNRT